MGNSLMYSVLGCLVKERQEEITGEGKRGFDTALRALLNNLGAQYMVYLPALVILPSVHLTTLPQ